MARYEIVFSRDTRKGREWVETHEFNGAFTRRHFKNTVDCLFFWAAQNCDYSMMTAEIRSNNITRFFLFLDTTQDGSDIWANLTIARPGERKQFLRQMVIAE